MSPLLALIITTTFVLWLLILEHKEAPNASLALWLPVTLTLILGSKSLGEWFQFGSSVGKLESPLDRNFVIVLIITGFFILVKRGFNFFQAIQENKLLLFLAGYMLVSVLWSDQLSVSFKRWVREILAPVIMSFIMLSENNSREAMFSVLRRTIYILIPFSLCLVRYFPLYGVQHGVWFGEIMWVGVTTQKNSLGRLCIIAIFYLTWSLIKKLLNRNIPAVKYQTAAEIILLIISCHLLIGPSIMAMSATSLAVLSIVLTIFILLLIGNKYKLYPSANILTILLAAGIILGVATLFTAGKAVGSFTPMLGRDATLTGRTDMWAVLLPKAMERAFLGHGYGGFWTQAWVDFFGANETHNGYLGILLDQGIIGLILMVLFLLTSCRKAQRLLENDFYWASLWIGFLFMSVFHNTAETSLNSFSSNLTLLLVFMSVSISSYNRYLPTEVRHEQNET